MDNLNARRHLNIWRTARLQLQRFLAYGISDRVQNLYFWIGLNYDYMRGYQSTVQKHIENLRSDQRFRIRQKRLISEAQHISGG